MTELFRRNALLKHLNQGALDHPKLAVINQDALDSGNMADWMRTQGFDSGLLDWTVNYGCRDDYGAWARDVWAWAGIHYFASRIGTARNADAHSVLTWPQGK